MPTTTLLDPEHAAESRLLAEHSGDAKWLSSHVEGCVHPWLDGYTCAFCELPVRVDGERDHPGYAVVERAEVDADDPHLRVSHRFCHHLMQLVDLPERVAAGIEDGLAAKRAWLGWATEEFLKGVAEKTIMATHFERLGLNPDRLTDPRAFKKMWVVAKMRWATHAAHYYVRLRRGKPGALDSEPIGSKH